MADYAKDVLVDTQWVQDHLEDDSIRIVEVDENPALYAEAHIPGAIGFDWKTDLQDQVKRDFLGPEAFGELFGSRGISNDHTIVLYGDRNNWFAANTDAIRTAGAEPYVGDPDRIATLMGALEGVTVVCWLAGTAEGDPEKVAALHDGRLRMLLEKIVDTPVRGLVYEAAGPLAEDVYANGRATAERARATWALPVEILDADPGAHEQWLGAAVAAVDRLLAGR